MKAVDAGIRPDISQLLGEMKALRERSNGFRPAGVSDDVAVTGLKGVLESGEANRQVPFSQLLTNAIDQVNEVQKESGKLSTAFQQGDPDTTLTEVVIASEKASIAFEAMTEVRNRLVNAYEDIMNMPI